MVSPFLGASSKTSKSVKNLTSKWSPNQQHFFTHAFSSLLSIRFIVKAIQSGEEACGSRYPYTTYIESLPIESKVYDFVTLTMTFIPKIAILDFVVTGAPVFHKQILFRVDLFADGSQVSDIGQLWPLVCTTG